MNARVPVILSLFGAAVLFGSIALVFVMVIASLALGGLDFPGEPEIADAAGRIAWGLAS
jgi:hypothetical protein